MRSAAARSLAGRVSLQRVGLGRSPDSEHEIRPQWQSPHWSHAAISRTGPGASDAKSCHCAHLHRDSVTESESPRPSASTFMFRQLAPQEPAQGRLTPSELPRGRRETSRQRLSRPRCSTAPCTCEVSVVSIEGEDEDTSGRTMVHHILAPTPRLWWTPHAHGDTLGHHLIVEGPAGAARTRAGTCKHCRPCKRHGSNTPARSRR